MSTPKQLTAEELKYIDGFCKKKDVCYIDLRIELVDHLAEMVLAYQEKHPNTSFHDAFHGVYKSFGIFGFMDIAAQHENQMRKRYWREIWQYTKSCITPPRVLLTLSASVGIYYLADALEATRMPLFFLGLALFLLSITLTIKQFLNNKKALGDEQTVLMAGASRGGGFTIFSYLLLYIPLQGFWVNPGQTNNLELITHPIYLSIFLVATSIFGLANYYLQEKAKEQLQEIKAKMA